MDKSILVLVKHKVYGNLRFLSHAETLRVFQRACVRADIKIHYSQGFNPRPKLSLPLPRSVGVEADDDLLCLRVKSIGAIDNQLDCLGLPFDNDQLKSRLSAQLPVGCELLSVWVEKTKASPNLDELIRKD